MYVTAGALQPKNLVVYFELILDELVSYGPGGDGLLVRPVVREGGQLREREAFVHRVFLSAVYCDSPARQKLAGVVQGASAYLMCMYCWMCGVKFNNMRMLGYRGPVVCRYGKLKGQEVQMGVNERSRLIAHEEQVLRGMVAETTDELSTNRDVGVHMLNPVVKALSYVDANSLFPVPLYHALYLGVVKDFVKALLQNGGREELRWDKRIVADRETHFLLPADFSRPLLSVVSKQGRMVIENWVRFLEVYSVYLFWPELGAVVLSPSAKKAWGHLRRFAMFFQRPERINSASQRLQRAKEAR